MEKNRISTIGIVGILASILVAVSLFLPWVTVNLPFNISETYTGLKIFENNDFEYYLFPVIAAILGVLSVLVYLFDTKKNGSVSTLIGIVLGLGVIILSYMTYDKLNESASIFGGFVSLDMGYGLIIALIGGVLIILTALMDR